MDSHLRAVAGVHSVSIRPEAKIRNVAQLSVKPCAKTPACYTKSVVYQNDEQWHYRLTEMYLDAILEQPC